MKTNPSKPLAAVVMGAVLMMAFQCGRDEEPEPIGGISIHNVHHSGCLSHTDKGAKGIDSPDSASVVYDAASMRLHVTHHNLMVNCGTTEVEGGIIVSANRNGQTIDIYEEEDENNPQADCMCSVDNEFDLSNIEHGTYTLVFHNGYPDPLTVTVTL